MTHIKTVAGLASTLESAGVVLLSRGGATSAAIRDSLASPKDQVVFHVPITNSKSLKPAVKTDSATGVRTTTYTGGRSIQISHQEKLRGLRPNGPRPRTNPSVQCRPIHRLAVERPRRKWRRAG